MMTFLLERHYPNAPITEAVIDLTVQPVADISLENLDAIRDEAYLQKEPIFRNQVQVAGTNVTTTREETGWRFRSGDGRHIYQARRDGFSISRLAPYQNWKLFSGEARRLWCLFRDSVRPVAVRRLGLRYINRIELPLPLTDFGEYLLTAPSVSPHLPQGLSNYVMSLTIPMDELVTVVITEAILTQDVQSDPRVRPNTLSVLLDIDVSQIVGLSSAEEHIWERFEHLRKVKNHAFESCITDKTRELFQ